MVPRPLEPPFPGGPGSSLDAPLEPQGPCLPAGPPELLLRVVREETAVHVRDYTHNREVMQRFVDEFLRASPPGARPVIRPRWGHQSRATRSSPGDGAPRLRAPAPRESTVPRRPRQRFGRRSACSARRVSRRGAARVELNRRLSRYYSTAASHARPGSTIARPLPSPRAASMTAEGGRAPLPSLEASDPMLVGPRDVRRGDLLDGLIHEYYGSAA